MKKPIYILVSVISAYSFGQSKITVYEAGTENPVAGAAIICNGAPLGRTNASGTLAFNTKCRHVDVFAAGFFKEDALVDKTMEVALARQDMGTKKIDAVTLTDKSDPRALEILRKVNANYSNNHPNSLPSYTYRSYEKMSYDFDEDSIKNYSDALNNYLKTAPQSPLVTGKKAKDSLKELEVKKTLQQSKLFLWERAMQYDYSTKTGEKTTVLDNRISGLQEPVYELMALRSNRNRIPREIREENRQLYRYFLTDSIDIEGRKNYVIRFRQVQYRQPVNRRKFNGYLYVDADTYALKKIESSSKEKTDGQVTSVWVPIDGKWFLKSESIKMKGGSFAVPEPGSNDKKTRQKFGTYAFYNADYFDVKSPSAEAETKTGYTLTVKNDDGSQLEMYRTEPLSAREKETYVQIDSLGKKYKADEKATFASALLKGKYRTGNVDFDLANSWGLNKYEGLRLGIYAKLNEKFNKYISPDAYVAYGFKDGDWKYGAGVDIKTTLAKNSFFRVEYFHDVTAAGRIDNNLWNFRMKLLNSGINTNNDRFFKYDGFRVGYQTDLGNAFTVDVSAKRQSEEAGFIYSFQNMGDKFDNFSTSVMLKFSPNSQNMMTPGGKVTYRQGFPEFYLNYEQGFKALDGDFSYSRVDALVTHQFRNFTGLTGFRVWGGFVDGDVPLWHQYEMGGLGATRVKGIFSHFNLMSYLGFATMPSGRYYSDKFVGYYVNQRLPFFFRTFGKTTSSFSLIYRGTIGDMKNPENHQFTFEKLDHLYQEAGLQWNHFLSLPVDLGFFYRVGYYATPVFKENFGIQLKLSALGF